MNKKALIFIAFISVIVILISINLFYLKITITLINSSRKEQDKINSKTDHEKNFEDTNEIVSYLKYKNTQEESNATNKVDSTSSDNSNFEPIIPIPNSDETRVGETQPSITNITIETNRTHTYGE